MFYAEKFKTIVDENQIKTIKNQIIEQISATFPEDKKKDAVEKIINNIFKNEEKIVHISSERMSLYDLYIKNGLVAEPITMSKEQKKTLPKDTSLINNSI
jgi:hypothetical protein